MLRSSHGWLSGAALLTAIATACIARRTGEPPRQPTRTPEISGVLRPGDPYGGPNETVAGVHIGLALGDSAARCRLLAAEAITDSAGAFHFASRPAVPHAPAWFLCISIRDDAAPSFPIYRGDSAPVDGAVGVPLVLECEFHGDRGSPECVRGRASRSYGRE